MVFHIGDVIEMRLPLGRLAYLQYISDSQHAEFVRVLPGLFETALSSEVLGELVAGEDRFVWQAGLELIVPRHGRLVGNQPVPPDRQSPPALREFCRPSAENPQGWLIFTHDGQEVSSKRYAEQHPDIDQTMLPTSNLPFALKLARLIQTGWSPKMVADGVLNVHKLDRDVNAPDPTALESEDGSREVDTGWWASDAFDNDAAMDWSLDLGQQSSWSLIERSLQAVSQSNGYIEAPEGQVALAAAATVAAAVAGDVSVPEEIGSFLARAGRPDKRLMQDAILAIDRVAGDQSEARDLWSEAGLLDKWTQTVAMIRACLQVEPKG